MSEVNDLVVTPTSESKPFNGTRVKDPSFGGWVIDKGFGYYRVEHPDKRGSRTELKNIEECIGFIIEQRIVNEVVGEFTIKQFNDAVQKIRSEIQISLGVPDKQ